MVDFLTQLINTIMETLPGLVAAIVWIIIGVVVGRVIGNIVNRVVDKYIEKPLYKTEFGKVYLEAGLDFSNLIGGLVTVYIVSLALLAAIGYIPLSGDAGQMIYRTVAYLPYLISGIAVLTLGMLLAIALARYVGRLIKVGFPERFNQLVQIVELVIMVGLIGMVLVIALNIMALRGDFVYSLLLGSLIIILGIIIGSESGKALGELSPDAGKLAPLVQTIIVMVFALVGITAIFSQYELVVSVIGAISWGLMLAFAVILIPVIFYIVKEILRK